MGLADGMAWEKENGIGQLTKIIYPTEKEIFCEWYECVSCGASDILEHYIFCPNCGRKIIK